MILNRTGWVLWFAALAISLANSLYTAAAYLIIVSLTGLAVKYARGGPHQLLDNKPVNKQYNRAVVVTDSLNGSEWQLFHGASILVNALLNKQLDRKRDPAGPHATVMLRLLIGGQWGLVLLSCASRDWSAVVGSLWLAFCTTL